jgi:serine/threonine protein kinase
MEKMSNNNPMENADPSPLAGLNPADLLKQGVAADSLVGEASQAFMPPSVEELTPLFPQFKILGLIGQGGMGAVYKVRQKELDRIVALKILPPSIGETTGFSDRFAREAKALAKLNHPGIVTLHEFGQSDGLYFILMEFVDGVNLAQLMQTGRISPREALAIVPQICDALQFAHDQGIVHRDIKPENLLLDRLGRVKIADFGIAKVVSGAAVGDRRDPDEESQLRSQIDATIAGKIIGTPHYMAPEQMEHPSDVDHRADIYALGVVFYQMLTGELPGNELQAPSRKVSIDVRLDEMVLRALEKEPERRYQTAREFGTVLEDMTPVELAPPPPPERRRMFRRWLWLFVVLGILGCLAGFAVSLMGLYVMPRKFEAECVVEIVNRGQRSRSASFFATAYHVIQSRQTLEPVVEELDLRDRWRVGQQQAVAKLRKMVNAQNLSGTDLVQIRVKHVNREEAVELVEGIVRQLSQRSIPDWTVRQHEAATVTGGGSSPVTFASVLVVGGAGGVVTGLLAALVLAALLQALLPPGKRTGGRVPLAVVLLLLVVPLTWLGGAGFLLFQRLRAQEDSQRAALLEELQNVRAIAIRGAAGEIPKVSVHEVSAILAGKEAAPILLERDTLLLPKPNF